jgi:hypothetical protein
LPLARNNSMTSMTVHVASNKSGASGLHTFQCVWKCLALRLVRNNSMTPHGVCVSVDENGQGLSDICAICPDFVEAYLPAYQRRKHYP